MDAINVKNLSKSFKDIIAVDDISFNIPYGQITALLGSNGAGKSTTLNMLAGLLAPTQGTIDYSGRNFTKHYKEIKSTLGYLTCDMALYDTFSIHESLKFLGSLKGFSNIQINDRIDELASQFDLTSFIDKNFTELSSGQKQKSLIAASVIHDPEILIFDEVTASLDLIISKEIMDFIKAQKERGKAVIFSTHILSEVEYLSDNILMIEKGKIVKETNYIDLIKSSNSQNLTDAFYKALKEEKEAA